MQHKGRVRTRPLCLALCALLLVGGVPAQAADAPRLLLGDDYPRVALDAIRRATATVDLALYLVIVPSDRPNDPVATLVDALLDAQRRGVQVTVVVEDSKAAENAAAVARLRQGGVLVRADSPAQLLHAKALVVDERWVVLGSANWSRAAFAGNAEASVWLDDPPLARILAQEIRGWAMDPGPVSVPVTDDGVAIPLAWLAPDGVLSRMVRDRADAAFRLALAFARDGAVPDTREAWQPYWDEVGIRHPRTQRKLRRRLTVDLPTSSWRATGGSDAISLFLPHDFWTFGYARALSTRAQFGYLLARAEALRSTRNPCWFRSQEDLAQATGISDATLSHGFLELERENLVEIHRGDAPDGDFADRPASVTCVNRLVSPADRQAAVDALGARYPAAFLREAQTIAASLNDPYDPVWLDALAQALERHGLPAVIRAHRQVLRRKPGSPGRTVSALLADLTRSPGP